MKGVFSFFVIFVLLSSFVLAEDDNKGSSDLKETVDSRERVVSPSQSDDDEQDDIDAEVEDSADDDETEIEDDELEEKDKLKERAMEDVQKREEIFSEIKQQRIENVRELKAQLKDRKEELRKIYAEEKESIRESRQKQNEVRLAVHALLASENITGGIGKEVSDIAKDFDNSLKDTEAAEDKITKRGNIVRLLFGGDFDSVKLIKEKVQNREEKIKRLQTILEQCIDCTEDVKSLLSEQIASLIQEQERLTNLADEEDGKVGLLGWLRK